MAITADDELRHQPTDDPTWRESIWFCWQLPEHDLGASVSFNYRPNLAEPISHLRVYLCRGVECENNKPLYFRHEQLGMPTGDFDDLSVEPGFRLRRIGPLQGFHLRYDDGERLKFEYELRFFAGAYHWADGLYPPPVYLGNRYHCPFTITGSFELDGRTYQVHHQGDHDHSWGTRPLDWHALEKIKYVAGQFGPDLAFSIATTYGDQGGLFPHGFVWDGQEMTPVADVELANEYDRDGVQRRLLLNLVDTKGRLTQVRGEVFANFPTEASTVDNPVIGTDYHNNDAFARMTIGGREGSGIVSYYWGRDYYHRVLMGEVAR